MNNKAKAISTGSIVFIVLLVLIIYIISEYPSYNDIYRTTLPTPTPIPQRTDIVYLTNTGIYYHANGCRYLKHSQIETTREQAEKRGYTACSICKP